ACSRWTCSRRRSTSSAWRTCGQDKTCQAPRVQLKLVKPMATRNQTDPRKNFVPKILPWLLAAAVFGIYALTLNRWVSLFNYLAVAKLSGWTWQPEVFNPLFFIV